MYKKTPGSQVYIWLEEGAFLDRMPLCFLRFFHGRHCEKAFSADEAMTSFFETYPNFLPVLITLTPLKRVVALPCDTALACPG